MYTIRRFCGILCLLLLCGHAQAQTIPLQNLDEDKFKKVVGDLSTNFLHTTVSGASSLGELYGFEIGLIAGQGKTPHLNEVAQQSGSDADADKLPHAALIGMLTVPFGITAELGLVPKVGSADFKYNSFSAAAKWTPTEVFGDLPLSLAVKLSHVRNNLDIRETVNSIPTTYNYIGKETALQFLVSKNFAIVEPYFGFGFVNAKGDLTGTGITNLFTVGTSSSVTRTGTMWMLGTEVKLLLVKLGVEYTSLFDTSRITGKLSFFF